MAEGAAAAAQAKERRKEQLRQWARSCTNQEPAEPRWQRRRRRRRRLGDCQEEEDEGDRGSQGEGDGRAVRFERASEFLATCAAGDLLEADEMLSGDSGKEVIDSTNTDGISALHQACIDENLEVVEFLVNHGANVNQADNEGWTPLHVAASCGYMEIAEYLLKHSANIAAVNSDGDVPLDIAEDDCMENLLRAEIAKGGVDIEAAKREEEEVMLRDARQWLNAGKIEDIRHSKTGASALHVAAAKGYIEVMRLLLQANYDPNSRDKDGWTPLHAAAHWGVEEACRLLVEHFCDMNALNTVGQKPCDVADEDVLSLLEELQKKQEDLRNEKEANLKRAVIDTNMEQHPSYTNKHRRSSVCRMSSKEKISVQDQSKERKTLGTICVGEEETISSSEEETASEHGSKTQVNENGLLPDAHNSTASSASSVQKPLLTFVTPILPLAGPAGPSMWRQTLRKTGIILVPQRGQKAAHDAWEILHKWNQKLKESGASSVVQAENKTGCMLASCREGKPSGHLNKEPLLARVQPTPSRWIFSPPESLQDCKKEDSEGGLQMKLDMVPTTQLHTNTSSSMDATSSTSSSSTCVSPESQDKRRSYQAPVRDEESESQRKARSRLMRQSRRSTQGVTLTDLKEAEKTMGKSVDTPPTETDIKAEDRGEKEQSLEGSDITRRLGLPSTEQNMSASPLNTGNSPSKKELESTSKEEMEAESQNHLTARDRRKWRKDQRLGLGTNSYTGMENEEAESVNHNETAGYGVNESWSSLLPHRTGSHTFQRHSNNYSSKEESEKDYKRLYENLFADNETLKDQLQETELKLTQIRLELERVTQRQERSAERPALLELERFERRALERKVAELEEELKVLSDLKADNQRLKDENAALIRVISKLSK
ncbi:protein phosphatase 1 regulatory subunit 12C isoform X5 [Xenopus laevis]|uniref:Protein phosphatase 1 regulatory subunit n=1 Tax=Xenopus laevis TaxID=8355 RepID=A0A8J1LD51_XENLA|nr:protein phosphatase 1 regulatory subunit 12C isoform X5 [Xenopus laevis]